MHFSTTPCGVEALYLFGSEVTVRLRLNWRFHMRPRLFSLTSFCMCVRNLASLFLSVLHLPLLTLFLLPPSRLSTTPQPAPLPPPRFCLTTVGLLWEVIRKNSAETHTAAAESEAFQSLLLLSRPALQWQKAARRVKKGNRVGGVGLVGAVEEDVGWWHRIFREPCHRGNDALVRPAFMC